MTGFFGQLYQRNEKKQNRERTRARTRARDEKYGIQRERDARLTDEEEERFEEARLKAAEEAKRKAEEEAKRRAEEEARLRAEEEAKRKAEEEAKRKAEEEARLRAEEEAKRKAEEEAKRKAEEEARLRAEEEAKRKAEEEAKRKAEEEARFRAEEEAKRKAEEEAKRKAEEEARLRAEEEAKRKAAEEAKRKAEEEARLRAEERIKEEAAKLEIQTIEMAYKSITENPQQVASFTFEGITYTLDKNPLRREPHKTSAWVRIVPRTKRATLLAKPPVPQGLTEEERKSALAERAAHEKAEAEARRQEQQETAARSAEKKRLQEEPVLNPVREAFEHGTPEFVFDDSAYKHCADRQGDSKVVGKMRREDLEEYVKDRVAKGIGGLKLGYETLGKDPSFTVDLGNRELIAFLFKDDVVIVRHVGPGK